MLSANAARKKPREKPPDEVVEQAMDSCQPRKRPAPESAEARVAAYDVAEHVSSCGQRVASFGSGGRLCQRTQEGATKKVQRIKSHHFASGKRGSKNFK